MSDSEMAVNLHPVVGGLDSVICADSLETMRNMPDGCIDAVVTDPPYCSGGVSEASRSSASGQGLRSENIARFGWFVGDNMGTAGLVWLLRVAAWECHRLLRGNGSMLMFCDWRMIPNIVPAVESCGFRYQNLVTWDKGCMGLGNGFRARHEQILHFTAGSPQYYSKSVGNVITCKRVTADKREHQTQKPVGLLTQLLDVVCPPGGVVLDPFAGSGSTLVAAKETGRHFIGIERDWNHCETARKRLDQGVLPFDTPNTVLSQNGN